MTSNSTAAIAAAPLKHTCWPTFPLLQAAPKTAVLNHIDKQGPIPPRKARALLVLGKASPPVVREVLVTLRMGSDKMPVVSNLEKVNIHSSKWETVPYDQRPHGVMDQVG